MRTVTMVVAGSAVLAIVGPASADLVQSLKCRREIAKQVEKVGKQGFVLSDACHKAQDKLGAPGNPGSCNSVKSSNFDPKSPGKYPKIKTAAEIAIAKQCLSGDPVLDNYGGATPDNAIDPIIDASVESSAASVVGTTNLAGNALQAKCLEEVGKQRTALLDAALKNVIKCQLKLDALRTGVFPAAPQPLDPSCQTNAVLDPADKKKIGAEKSIDKKCALVGVTGAMVGSCSPLPTCVTDDARAEALDLGKAAYQTCGDGVKTGPEQCDDGNLTDGDGCNHLCENELGTCTPSSSPNAHRVVTVSVDTPTPLAGARIDLTYPLFEASIPGTGGSSIVQNAVNLLQSGGLVSINDDDLTRVTIATAGTTNFITTGPLVAVTFDNCLPLATTFCNRTKNVTECSLAPKRCTCAVAADCGAGGACPTTGTSAFLCGAGNVERQSCTADTDCAGGQTCAFDPAGGSNDPLCKPGNYPTLVDNVPPYVVGTEIGPCNGTANGPPGGCPGDNVCVTQASATACTISGATDDAGTPVDGVTCSVNIVEQP